MRARYWFYGAAVAIATAGILHLIALASDPHHTESMSVIIFFSVAAVAQLFWVIPTARRWGKPWHFVGIAGNIALIVLWALTRMPGNPITEGGEAEPITGIGIAVEVAEAAYTGLILSAIVVQERMMRIDHRRATDAA